MPFTIADVIEMRDKLLQLEIQQGAQNETDSIAKLAVAQTWWDTIKPSTPTTRAEGLAAYNFVEAQLETQTINFNNETDPVQKEIFKYRGVLLRQKLKLANEKFRERKANG